MGRRRRHRAAAVVVPDTEAAVVDEVEEVTDETRESEVAVDLESESESDGKKERLSAQDPKQEAKDQTKSEAASVFVPALPDEKANETKASTSKEAAKRVSETLASEFSQFLRADRRKQRASFSLRPVRSRVKKRKKAPVKLRPAREVKFQLHASAPRGFLEELCRELPAKRRRTRVHSEFRPARRLPRVHCVFRQQHDLLHTSPQTLPSAPTDCETSQYNLHDTTLWQAQQTQSAVVIEVVENGRVWDGTARFTLAEESANFKLGQRLVLQYFCVLKDFTLDLSGAVFEEVQAAAGVMPGLLDSIAVDFTRKAQETWRRLPLLRVTVQSVTYTTLATTANTSSFEFEDNDDDENDSETALVQSHNQTQFEFDDSDDDSNEDQVEIDQAKAVSSTAQSNVAKSRPVASEIARGASVRSDLTVQVLRNSDKSEVRKLQLRVFGHSELLVQSGDLLLLWHSCVTSEGQVAVRKRDVSVAESKGAEHVVTRGRTVLSCGTVARTSSLVVTHALIDHVGKTLVSLCGVVLDVKASDTEDTVTLTLVGVSLHVSLSVLLPKEMAGGSVAGDVIRLSQLQLCSVTPVQANVDSETLLQHTDRNSSSGNKHLSSLLVFVPPALRQPRLAPRHVIQAKASVATRLDRCTFLSPNDPESVLCELVSRGGDPLLSIWRHRFLPLSEAASEEQCISTCEGVLRCASSRLLQVRQRETPQRPQDLYEPHCGVKVGDVELLLRGHIVTRVLHAVYLLLDGDVPTLRSLMVNSATERCARVSIPWLLENHTDGDDWAARVAFFLCFGVFDPPVPLPPGRSENDENNVPNAVTSDDSKLRVFFDEQAKQHGMQLQHFVWTTETENESFCRELQRRVFDRVPLRLGGKLVHDPFCPNKTLLLVSPLASHALLSMALLQQAALKLGVRPVSVS